MSPKEAAERLDTLRLDVQRRAAGLPGAVHQARKDMTLRKLLALFWWRKLRKRLRCGRPCTCSATTCSTCSARGTEVRLVQRENVEHVVERLVNAGKPDQAVKVLALVKQMFDLAVRAKAIETSPAANVSATDFDGIETDERDVSLTPDGLGRLWRVLHELPPAPRVFAERRETTRLGLVVLRPRAAARANSSRRSGSTSTWARGVWNVPPEVRNLTRKQLVNARTDVVHLPPQALRAVERLRELAPSSPWVLATPADSRTGHVAENAVSRALKDMQRAEAFGKAPLGRDKRGRPQVVRPHDFRRSFRSTADEKPWGENGRRPAVGARAVHRSHPRRQDPADVQLATFDEERAAVLGHWCAYLNGLAALRRPA